MRSTIIIITLGLTTTLLGIRAQSADPTRYERSSLYSILINNPEKMYNTEIQSEFINIPIPDKFYDHNLSVRSIQKEGSVEEESISAFLENNKIAYRLVGRWFNRNIDDGTCNINLVNERGNYNANYYDVQSASQNIRGLGMLADAGENLIENTYVIVNDITYFDQKNASSIGSAILQGVGMAATMYTGNDLYQNMGANLAGMVSRIEGFTVTTTSYLYKLEWTPALGNLFYSKYYTHEPSEEKNKLWKNAQGEFTLRYIGKFSGRSSKTSMMGINKDKPTEMIRKVCARAVDKSVIELQRQYEEFKVKTPIYSYTDGVVKAKVGKKEDITEKTIYEVISVIQDENGKHTYKQLAQLRPIPSMIWDNRFMAAEEQAEGSTLDGTSFEVISGTNKLTPGMLIREYRIK